MRGSFNWTFVLKVVGFILIIESFFVFVSSGVAYWHKGDDFKSLIFSGILTLLVGGAFILSGRIKKQNSLIGKRESYLSVALSWTLFALMGAFPFFFSGYIPSFTDAFFESTSGITTTGASILDNIEAMPKGLLFWRSILQWLGGMGIVVFTLAIMPLVGGGAAQLFNAEASGLTHDKFRPRVTQMAKRLWIIYMTLTAAVIVLLGVGPMEWFDAFCHGLTTISTGGFSTKSNSLAFWDSLYIEGVILIFMIFGAINFVLIYHAIKGQFKRLIKDEELRWFFVIIVVATIIITLGLTLRNEYPPLESLRYALFNIVSVFTTTGFTTVDFSSWGSFFLIIFIFLMVVCGCAGSTSGGLKTVRAVVLAKDTFVEFKRLVHPRAIIPVRLNGNALSFGVVQRLLAFVFLYIAIIFISWFILSLMGMSFEESLSSSISAISNVGPAFGDHLNSMSSYSQVPTLAKWYLALLMIIGRLELFTILILFTPGFWKR